MITDSYGNRRFYGLYRGVVTANNDPMDKGRVRLQVPQVLGTTQTDWAWPQKTQGVTVVAPALNQGVWVMFEGGDPSFPIWTGVFSNSATLSLALNDLSDVNTAGVTNGQVLKYDSATQTWLPGVGGGSSVGALDDLTDVTLTSIANGNTLVYNSSTTQWVNVTTIPPGGSTGQILTKSSNTDYATAWIDNYADWTSVVKHTVRADENIAKGQAVYVSSSNGTNMFVSLASHDSEAKSSKTMGIAASAITTTGPTSTGFIITEGLLGGLDTSSGNAGDPIWLGTSGNLIFGLTNKPVAPDHLVFLGIVTKKSAGNGEIFVKVQNGFELQELHNVLIGTGYSSTPANKDLLAYDTASSLWKNKTAASLGIVTTGDTGTVTSTMIADGTIVNADIANATIKNAKLEYAYVTINGTTFDLGTSGTIVVSGSNFAAQSANVVFAGPATGSSAYPGFRSLVLNDLPTITVAKGGTGQTSSLTQWGVIYADATTSMASSAAATGGGQVFVSGASGTAAPVWVTNLSGITINSTTIPTSATLVKTSDTIAVLSAPTADFSMNTNKLTSVKDPTSAQDAATKSYVDGRLTVGTSPPGSPQDEDLWYDTTDGTLYIRYNDGVGSPATQWVQIASNASIDTALTNRVSTAEGNITTLQSNVTSLQTSFNVLSSNFVINGAFDIWQRGTSSTTSAVYIADRWIHSWSAGTATASQATDVPSDSGLQYSFSLASTSGTKPTVVQRIESNNSARFAGQTVTLSVWAKSTTGTGSLKWATYYPVSTDNFTALTSDTSGTFAATMTVGVWTRYSATFTTNALATRGYEIDFYRDVTTTSTTTLYAGTQLELGSVMTAFRRNAPSIQAELAACQRYFIRLNPTSTIWGNGIVPAQATTVAYFSTSLPVRMRVIPTGLTFTGNGIDRLGIGSSTATMAAQLTYSSDTSIAYSASSISPNTATGSPVAFTGILDVTAEL